MMFQTLTTPCHLIALDLYNRPGENIASRLGFLRREYVKTCCARFLRILPAFGFGGIGNTWLREHYNAWCLEAEEERQFRELSRDSDAVLRRTTSVMPH